MGGIHGSSRENIEIIRNVIPAGAPAEGGSGRESIDFHEI
jgi:hypothetical protein